MRKFTAISLFCGAGGLDMGFHNKGFQTIWANDADIDACRTFKKWNSDCEVVCGKIENIPSFQIPDADIILGGFPCQGFSLSGPRKLSDNRNNLYKEYVRIVKDKQPKLFVGENVQGLLSMGAGAILEAIVDKFASCGYRVSYELLNAKEHNVPQDRKRLIIIGIRKDLKVNSISIPKLNKVPALFDYIGHLSKINMDDVCQESFSSRYMSRNRKRNWNEVSFTIPAMAKQVPLHPSSPDMIKIDRDLWKFGEGETRRLSYKECALIQTFPDNMEFIGNLNSKYKQIGNAVPVNLAECVATSILESGVLL